MLILSRNVGERVFLLLPSGEEIVVTMVGRNHHGHFRLGFDAPEGVVIRREELLDRPKTHEPGENQ